MDTFFSDASLSKLIEQGSSILLAALLVAIIIFVSERAFGLNIKGAINVLEDMQQRARDGRPGGNAWPLTVVLLVGLIVVVWLVRV